jgi:hypothetical protein
MIEAVSKVAEIRAIVLRTREIVTFVRSHKYVQAMLTRHAHPQSNISHALPEHAICFRGIDVAASRDDRSNFDAMLGVRLEMWNEATSSVDTRVVENVEQTLRSYVFWKQAESALALLQPLSDAIHHVESDDCKSSWVFPLVNALLADCMKWSETAGDLYRDETKLQVIKAFRDRWEGAGPPVALKSDVVLFAWLVDPNTCPSAGDPRPDNILETAGRFLTKYIDQKDIPQAMEELDTAIVREGEFGYRAKLLQESSALTESEKRIVKSETLFCDELYARRSPCLQNLRNEAQDNFRSSSGSSQVCTAFGLGGESLLCAQLCAFQSA